MTTRGFRRGNGRQLAAAAVCSAGGFDKTWKLDDFERVD
jgi:hypothetical protein